MKLIQLLSKLIPATTDAVNVRIGVACSGGIDSIALLHAAHVAGLNPVALHINHGIHLASDEWARHVQSVATALNLTFDTLTVSGLSADMPSLEAAARHARHDALIALCARHGITHLLLAHHANDQAETVLLNLLRGTGLAGVGMPPSRLNTASTTTVVWLRPWINVPKADINAYVAAHQLRWIDDPSNGDTTIRRNAVRHTLWPVLESVEPRALTSLNRFATIAQEAAQIESALAARVIKPHRLSENALNWYALVNGESERIQLVLLRAWVAMLGARPPTTAHCAAMVAQLNARTGDGLRCSHGGFEFVYIKRLLHAIKQ